MASEELTKNIAYIVLIILFAGMAWLIAKRARENRQSMLEDLAPKIAGEDTLEGGAIDPSQFDEPDDEALDEMSELLGLDDEEEDQ